MSDTGDNLVLENLNDFAANSISTLFFANNLNGVSNAKYTGAIKAPLLLSGNGNNE